MKITYIHHSSFLVEEDSFYLLFDYFEGSLPKLDQTKPLYIFASHRHPDHFSPIIFEIGKSHPKTRYILSSDIWRKRVPPELLEHTLFLKPSVQVSMDMLQIETYKSTDEGVAFLISACGHTIYHAGDLNDWSWAGEEKSCNIKMQETYRSIISKMQGKRIDTAFLPLDPRQEEFYSLGMEYFLGAISPDHVFPMHFWGNYGIIDKMCQRIQITPYRTKIHKITFEGQQFEIPGLKQD